MQIKSFSKTASLIHPIFWPLGITVNHRTITLLLGRSLVQPLAQIKISTIQNSLLMALSSWFLEVFKTQVSQCSLGKLFQCVIIQKNYFLPSLMCTMGDRRP